jgi:hypothetical protein
VLRIVEADPSAGFREEDVRTNYESALKVLEPRDPDSSRLLRKPRSPYGQGDPDPTSPTGWTHVGGTRWSSTEHPAYRVVRDWIWGVGETPADR